MYLIFVLEHGHSRLRAKAFTDGNLDQDAGLSHHSHDVSAGCRHPHGFGP